MAARKKIPKGTKKKGSFKKSQATIEPDSAWQRFTKAFPEHPALEEDVIYSLPGTLLAAINIEIPGFFPDEDQAFEKTLTEMSGAGFFLKNPFAHPLLPQTPPSGNAKREGKWDDLAKRRRESDRRIREMMAELMIGAERTDEEIQQYFTQGPEFENRMEIRRKGYAGWLVTDPRFRQEREEFCESWADHIQQQGEMPRVPFSLMGESPSPIPKNQREFYGDYMLFYNRWGLESLATWELPVPLRPEFLDFSLYHLNSLSEAGVTIFVPFYLLRDRSLTLYEVAEHQRLFEPMSHLKGWLDLQKNWGFERYAAMFQLYLYLELALKRRYGDRLHGNVAKLDQAFARYQKGLHAESIEVDTTAESIKKIRQEMQKRLRQSK